MTSQRSARLSFAVEDPAAADARWCIEQYFAELNARFEMGFDPSISISADAHELVAPNGLLIIARDPAGPVGCGALKLHPGAPAELKRMWVAPRGRGSGLGRRILRSSSDTHQAAGVEVLRLETNGALTEAIGLYRSAGFLEVTPFNDEPYAHFWFEKRLSAG